MSLSAVLSVEAEAEIMNGTAARPPAPASGGGNSNWKSPRANFGQLSADQTLPQTGMTKIRRTLRDQEEDRVWTLRYLVVGLSVLRHNRCGR